MRSSFLSFSKRSLSSSKLLAISRLNEAVTLRSKAPSLVYTYGTKKGSTLTSLFVHTLGGPNFSRGVPILQENLFRTELIFIDNLLLIDKLLAILLIDKLLAIVLKIMLA